MPNATHSYEAHPAACALGRTAGRRAHFLMPSNAQLTMAVSVPHDEVFLPVLHQKEPAMGGTATLTDRYRAMYYARGCSDLHIHVPLGAARQHGNNRVDLALRLLRRRCRVESAGGSAACNPLEMLSTECWAAPKLRRELLRVNGSMREQDVPGLLQVIASSTPWAPAPLHLGEFSGRGFLNFYLADLMAQLNVTTTIAEYEYAGNPINFRSYPFKTEVVQRRPVSFYSRNRQDRSYGPCKLVSSVRCSFCAATPMTRLACGFLG